MKIQIKNAVKEIAVKWEEYFSHAILSIIHYSSRYEYYTEQYMENEFRILPSDVIFSDDVAQNLENIFPNNLTTIKLIPNTIDLIKFNFISSYYHKDKETEEFLFLIRHSIMQKSFVTHTPIINSITYTNVEEFKENWKDATFFETNI